MKQFLSTALCASLLAVSVPMTASAANGVIKRACMASDRPAANNQLCGCVQRVANQALSRSERKRVARWFSDPHQAQVVRMSDSRSDEELWLRYKEFGQLAQAVCR